MYNWSPLLVVLAALVLVVASRRRGSRSSVTTREHQSRDWELKFRPTVALGLIVGFWVWAPRKLGWLGSTPEGDSFHQVAFLLAGAVGTLLLLIVGSESSNGLREKLSFLYRSNGEPGDVALYVTGDAGLLIGAGFLCVAMSQVTRGSLWLYVAWLLWILGTIMTGYALRLRTARRRQQILERLSHDLRTPAAGIRSLVDALESGSVDKEETRAHYLSLIRGEADRLARGLNRMLSVARGKVDLDASRVRLDVSEWLRDVTARWRTRIPELETEAPERCPAEVDPERLDEAVDALLDNAMRHGGERVRLHLRSSDGIVSLVISDDGPGIAPEDRERIVTLAAAKDAPQATSASRDLGVWAAGSVAAAHGGKLRLEGTNTFLLEFPER